MIMHGKVVFGLVRNNFVTSFTPGPNALCPFLSQTSIQVTAMLQLVPMALLKSPQEGPELAIQVLVIYTLLPRCSTEVYPSRGEIRMWKRTKKALLSDGPRNGQLWVRLSGWFNLKSHCPRMIGKWLGTGNSQYSFFFRLKLHWFSIAPFCLTEDCPSGQAAIAQDGWGSGAYCVSGCKLYCCDGINSKK